MIGENGDARVFWVFDYETVVRFLSEIGEFLVRTSRGANKSVESAGQ